MEYIFVKKSFRISYPKDPNYMCFSDFKHLMLHTHGLEVDGIGYCGEFDKEIDTAYIPFRVVDKAKAMMFAFNNSEYVKKPE